MAVADMFLKVQGVTGEADDKDHKGEIEVVSWSWGMQGSRSAAPGGASGKAALGELQIVKRVDQSSPTLMKYVRGHKLIPEAKLTVRKAGKEQLEYLTVDLEDVRVTSLRIDSENVELVERISLGFQKVRVTYAPQGSTGAQGKGSNIWEATADEGWGD